MSGVPRAESLTEAEERRNCDGECPGTLSQGATVKRKRLIRKDLLVGLYEDGEDVDSAGAVKKLKQVSDTRPPSFKFTTRANKYIHDQYKSTYNSGPFTTSEKRRVEKVLNSFLEENNIPRVDLNFLLMRRKGFVNGQRNPYKGKPEWTSWIVKVYKRCNLNRTLTQFNHYIRRACGNDSHSRVPWTKEEDKALLELHMLKGNKWREIELDLGRKNARSRYMRLQHLKKNSSRKGKFTYEELCNFGRAVRKVCEEGGIEDMKTFNMWSLIETQMPRRSAAQLQKCWSCNYALIMDLIDKDPSSLSDTRDPGKALSSTFQWTLERDRMFIARMLEMCRGARDETEVIWESLIPNEWKNVSGRSLKIRWAYLRYTFANLKGVSFIECIKRCQDAIEELANNNKEESNKRTSLHVTEK